MRNIIIIIVIFISNQFFCHGQELTPNRYGIGLSELTTFADNHGFKDTIEIKDNYNSINWVKEEDGYYSTKDIEYTSVFTYKVIFSKNNIHIVNVFLSSTGTANLSYIFRVKALNDKLILLDVITGGDRCQKGVNLDEVEIKNGVIFYSHFITPHHLMSWNTKMNDNSFSDCMVCCCGFANYRYDLASNKRHFDNIVLFQEALVKERFIRDIYNDFVSNNEDTSYLILNEESIDVFIYAVETLKNTPPKEGAIKTKDGVLIYYNYQNPFTIHLKGDVDLSNQTMNINGNLFDFTHGSSEQFGKTEEEILINYMNWEQNYLEDVLEKPVKTESDLINNNGILVNLWNYTNPVLIDDKKFNKKAFYADFYKNGFIYRFSFMAFNGTKVEANKILTEYINEVHFYNAQINLNKLQDAIRNGKNKY
jgi:hypothetical protein